MTRLILQGFLLFLVYWVLAVLGLQWARVGGAGSAVWPAFGVALAGLLLWGWRLWPAIFLGRLLAGIATGSVQPLWAEAAIAASNAGADLLAALILQRWARIDISLRTGRDVLSLVGGVAAAAALSATLGTAILAISSGLGAAAAMDVWSGWWFGNVVAGITITPLILSWAARDAWPMQPRAAAHLALCLVVTAVLGWLIFSPDVAGSLRSWHLFPVLIWAALAFHVRGASAALMISSAFALWGVSTGSGPLFLPGGDPVMNTQQFIAVTSLTGILLAAISDERRRTEAVARLAAIASSSPDAMISTDRAGCITSWNRGAERLFGWSAAEATGTHLTLIAPPAGGARPGTTPQDLFPRVLSGEAVDVETVRGARDGSAIDVHLVATQLRGESGEVTGALVVLRDIRARKRAEAALAEEREALEVLNRTGAALASELELDRIVQMVTDAGRDLTGAAFGAFFYNVYDREGGSLLLYTLSGAERSQFEHFGLPRATKVFAPTFVGEGVVRSDDITRDPRYGHNPPHRGMPEGHLPVRSYLAVPVYSRDGSVLGGLFFGHPEPAVFSERSERILVGLAAQAAIAVDNSRLFREAQDEIAERRRAEAALRDLNDTLEQRVEERTRELVAAQDQLRQAQKMEAIGQLTGGVAHDFNNLLTIIRSSVDLLRRGSLSDEKRERYLEAISDTSDRAAKLTAQLLAFARRQALKPELFDVTERIQILRDMIRTVLGSRIVIELDLDCDDCFAEADIAQFETALINIAVNARDAMEGEGRLTISARRVPAAPNEEMPEASARDWIVISIGDTGRGIAPELIEQIFEPFFTTKEVGKGTGLGLSQVYGFAKQSGGDVRVASEVGAGTTFSLYLPRFERPEPAQQPDAERLHDGNVAEARILVVEDNVDVGAFARQLLTELGHEATLAGDGQAALRLLEEDHGRYDLVFSDVVMPGMSGIELAQEIRRRWPSLRVVLTSGYSHVLAQQGHHGFELLKKPYSVEGLTAMLHGARAGGGE